MSSVVLVRATKFLHVRNGLIQTGNKRGYRWGSTVDVGTTGVLCGPSSRGRDYREVAFELPFGQVVTDDFHVSDFEQL